MQPYREYQEAFLDEVLSEPEMTEAQIEADIREAWEEVGGDGITATEYLDANITTEEIIYETVGRECTAYVYNRVHEASFTSSILGVYGSSDQVAREVICDGGVYLAQHRNSHADEHPLAVFREWLEDTYLVDIEDALDDEVKMSEQDKARVAIYAHDHGMDGLQLPLVVQAAGLDPLDYPEWSWLAE